jgi:rhodanese-related sulfurtransferase
MTTKISGPSEIEDRDEEEEAMLSQESSKSSLGGFQDATEGQSSPVSMIAEEFTSKLTTHEHASSCSFALSYFGSNLVEDEEMDFSPSPEKPISRRDFSFETFSLSISPDQTNTNREEDMNMFKVRSRTSQLRRDLREQRLKSRSDLSELILNHKRKINPGFGPFSLGDKENVYNHTHSPSMLKTLALRSLQIPKDLASDQGSDDSNTAEEQGVFVMSPLPSRCGTHNMASTPLSSNPTNVPLKTLGSRTKSSEQYPCHTVRRTQSSLNLLPRPELNLKPSSNDVDRVDSNFLLPILREYVEGIAYLSPKTLQELLSGELKIDQTFCVVDCRFDYEYNGGHIKHAINLSTRDAVEQEFFANIKENTIVIFHCEFSSERAPNLCRFMREKDRSLNVYPTLNYTQLYILEKGYKEFYLRYPEFCFPRAYVPMEDNRFIAEKKRQYTQLRGGLKRCNSIDSFRIAAQRFSHDGPVDDHYFSNQVKAKARRKESLTCSADDVHSFDN